MGRGFVPCAKTIKGTRQVKTSCYGVPGRADRFVTVIYIILIKGEEM